MMRIATGLALCALCAFGLSGCDEASVTNMTNADGVEPTGAALQSRAEIDGCPAACGVDLYDVSRLQDEAVALQEQAIVCGVELSPPDGGLCAVPACDALATEYQTMKLENETAAEQLRVAKTLALETEAANNPNLSLRVVDNPTIIQFEVGHSGDSSCGFPNPVKGWDKSTWTLLEAYSRTGDEIDVRIDSWSSDYTAWDELIEGSVDCLKCGYNDDPDTRWVLTVMRH